jgi:regulator of cell morphogenesis and NO signaling
MMTEHDRAGELLRALREVARDYTLPDSACASFQALYQALPEFEADLHQHIHLENNILFPRAVALEEQAAPERRQVGSEYRCLGD